MQEIERENPNSSRYTLVHGKNFGDVGWPEVVDDHEKETICSSDNIKEITTVIRRLINQFSN